jgi:hypothetical protein
MEEQPGKGLGLVVGQLMVLEDRRWGWRGVIEWYRHVSDSASQRSRFRTLALPGGSFRGTRRTITEGEGEGKLFNKGEDISSCTYTSTYPERQSLYCRVGCE